jgi:hypothetical protein
MVLGIDVDKAPIGGDARDGRIDCRSRSVRGNADPCLSLP